jgi:hypothetical protein
MPRLRRRAKQKKGYTQGHIDQLMIGRVFHEAGFGEPECHELVDDFHVHSWYSPAQIQAMREAWPILKDEVIAQYENHRCYNPNNPGMPYGQFLFEQAEDPESMDAQYQANRARDPNCHNKLIDGKWPDSVRAQRAQIKEWTGSSDYNGFHISELCGGHKSYTGCGFRGDREAMKKAWPLLKDYVIGCHCRVLKKTNKINSMPWAWWEFESPEPRRDENIPEAKQLATMRVDIFSMFDE